MSRWKNASFAGRTISELKRAAVLRESGRLFSRRGYHNTSLSDVAKQLGVSKGTLYNYVKDKQEILFEIHRMALEIGTRSLAEAEASNENGAQMVAAAMKGFILSLVAELGGYGILSEVGALKPDDRDQVMSLRSNFYQRFEALVTRGIHDGSIRSINPHVPLVAFMGVLQNLPNWYSPKGRLTAEEIAEAVVEVFMRGFALGEHPAPPEAARNGGAG